ncbi:MAG: NAD(P)/FAD-dependent oxidoreductase [Pseudomonadota bacterium]
MAARELAWAGKTVRVFEAKDRLGGRAWASHLGDTPIERGGGYVHWSQPHIWAEITRYGLTLKERPYYTTTNAMRKTRFLVDGELHAAFTPEETADIGAAFAAYLAPAREVFPTPYDPFATDAWRAYDGLSAADRIAQMDLSDLVRATLLRTSAMQCNNDPHQGAYLEALRWYALAQCHDETYAASVSRFTLAEGSGALLAAIARDAGDPVTLSGPVTRIGRDGVHVVAETPAGPVAARRCIVATGVNVWKNIHFEPALSEPKLKLSQEELSGKGGKIYVELEGSFEDSRWGAVGGKILSVLPHRVAPDRSVVVAFTNPEYPFETLDNATLGAEMARFDPACRVRDFSYHDWVADPHVGGTWGNLRPGQFGAYLRGARAPEGPVHFAGGDIAVGWRGFFDGAVESGAATARAVLAELG